MHIFREVNGGFGTTVFRYMAATLFSIIYGGTSTSNIYDTTYIINDEFYSKWMEKLTQTGEIEDINGELFRLNASPSVYSNSITQRDMEIQQRLINISHNVIPYSTPQMNDPVIISAFKNILTFPNIPPVISPETLSSSVIQGFFVQGTFQHDVVYNMYKSQIVNWMRKNPQEALVCANFFKFYPEDLISHLSEPSAEVVLHIQLGDFIGAGRVAHPLYIIAVLNKINSSKIRVVSRTPETFIEKLYLKFITDRYYVDMKLCDSIINEYNYIRNAKTVVSSLSPTCWAACFFSTVIETVYFPDCSSNFPNQTFSHVTENTIPFEFKQIYLPELELFFEVEPSMKTKLSSIAETIPPVITTALSRISPPIGARSRRGMPLRL